MGQTKAQRKGEKQEGGESEQQGGRGGKERVHP